MPGVGDNLASAFLPLHLNKREPLIDSKPSDFTEGIQTPESVVREIGRRGRKKDRKGRRFLKHHHYIHHIDNESDVNFLLPLCDLHFGALRTRFGPREIENWGTFEEALARVVPVEEQTALDPRSSG